MGNVERIMEYVLIYGLLAAGFLFFTGMNYGVLVFSRKKTGHVPSPAPFLGGICGFLLVLLIFRFRYPWLLLLPFVIDPGSIPLLVMLVIRRIKKRNQ